MSTKFLTATVSAIVLMASTGAYAHDMKHKHYNDGGYNDTTNNMNDNAAIQKGGSASVKSYGANKQGDHYNTNNVRADKRDMHNSMWDDTHYYPGSRVAYGAKDNLVIQKGGSAVTDSHLNTHVGQDAAARPYGTYWR